MTKLELLIESVEKRLPVSFQYNKPGKTEGVRIGNVHAVFIFTAKDGTETTKVAVYQTDGVSDTAQEIPGWRPLLNIEHVSDVKILEDLGQFEEADGYNADSYDKPIAKI
jgi:hypothetical protein